MLFVAVINLVLWAMNLLTYNGLSTGQSMDSAHLPNERIRLENLLKGKQVLKNFLHAVSVT